MYDSTLATNMEPCLDCACSNAANVSAKRLLESCGARTSTGVSAAFFIAAATEQLRIAELVVAALEEQRRGCYPSSCERLRDLVQICEAGGEPPLDWGAT
jgi:hypothetical protein